MKKDKLNILVLAGGESAEREVSLTSARAMVEALVPSGHRLKVLDTLTGHYLAWQNGQLIDQDMSLQQPVNSSVAVIESINASLLPERLREVRRGGTDVALLALHGGAGENGLIQSLLELIGMPYTGSPPAASAIGMNKDISKRVMTSLGIPTARWRRYDRRDYGSIEEVTRSIGSGDPPLPLVIKPRDGGSTVGLTLVETPDQIGPAVETALAVDESLIAEAYLKGREITIAVLDGQALPPVEIRPTHRLYDYTCKYTKGKSQYICPAPIGEEITRRLSQDAVTFYRTIGCRGYARIDFIVADRDDYICLELNTLPGMTALSLFPMAAKAVGLEFDQLLDKLCRLALEKK